MKLGEMPHVIQFNKRDLAKLTGIEDLNAALNKYNAPFYESVATTGIGVQDTLKAITKLVLLHLTRKYDPKNPPERTASPPRAAAPPPPPTPTPAAKMAAPPPTPRPAPRPAPVRAIPLSSMESQPAVPVPAARPVP